MICIIRKFIFLIVQNEKRPNRKQLCPDFVGVNQETQKKTEREGPLETELVSFFRPRADIPVICTPCARRCPLRRLRSFAYTPCRYLVNE